MKRRHGPKPSKLYAQCEERDLKRLERELRLEVHT